MKLRLHGMRGDWLSRDGCRTTSCVSYSKHNEYYLFREARLYWSPSDCVCIPSLPAEDSFPYSHERLYEISWNFFTPKFTLLDDTLLLLSHKHAKTTHVHLHIACSLLSCFCPGVWCQIISGQNQSESAVWCREEGRACILFSFIS